MNSPRQPGPAATRQLLRAIDPGLRLVSTRPMTGGVSAAITAIEAESPGGRTEWLVLRQYGAADVASNPHVAACEHRLLTTLHAVGLPVPRPYFTDESRTILPGPCLVIEFIDGEPVTEPPEPAGFAGQLAGALAALHKAGVTLADAAYLPDLRDTSSHRLRTWPSSLDEPLSEAPIWAALAGGWPPSQRNDPAVLHGDFWPGNTLWRHGRLVGVIDWEDAAFGDPLADLGNARLEIRMAFGARAMDDFTRQYCRLMPDLDLKALPYWDLYAALRLAGKMAGWGLPPADLATLRAGHREFVAMTLARL